MGDPIRDEGSAAGSGGDRLESWKEIAVYLRRDARTVQRWERLEGLPVRRQLHGKAGSVYAYRHEIDGWRHKRHAKPVPWLSYIAAGFGILALVVLIWYVANWWVGRHRLAPIQAIAVLPLDNLSGDATQDYLTEGLTDEIITDLAKLGGARVISRTSIMRYKGTHRPIPEIARELNVEAIVEGSFERLGDKVRLRVQLIRAATDQHIWAEEYDREATDIFHLESDVARDIAIHVQLKAAPSQPPLRTATHTTDPQAFQDYLQGRHYLALRTKESIWKAVEYFESAVQKDPNDARSYAGLAHCYLVLPFLTALKPEEGFQRAREETDRALLLDSSLAEAHLANAMILMYHDWNLRGSNREFRRALELNPNDSTGHQWHGEVLAMLGQGEEAVREEQTALALDPLSTIIHHELGNILRDTGRYDDALRAYQETLRLDPQFWVAHWELARSFRQQEKFAESMQELKLGAAGVVYKYGLNPGVISAVDELPSAYAKSGREGYFRQWLKIDAFHPRPAYYMARDYLKLGDKESAIDELKRSFKNHDPEILWLFADSELEPIHDDRRYQELVRAIDFR